MKRLLILLLCGLALGLTGGVTRTVPSAGLQPNVLTDTNGDGTIDSILVGDYDGDGKLETIDDVQGAVLALNAAAGASVQKHIQVAPGHFYASIAGDANSDICDATCLALLEPTNNADMVGMITLMSNTHLEGSGQGITIIQGFQMAGAVGSVTGFPPTGNGDSHSIISNSDFDNVQTNIEISNLTTDVGQTWYNSTSDSTITSTTRGIDLHGVTNSYVHHTTGQNSGHASIFVSDSTDVVISDNTSLRAGSYFDQANAHNQAGIYIFACDVTANCSNRTPTKLASNIVISNNTIIDNGGTGINIRNDTDDDGARLTNLALHGNRISGASACVTFKGASNSQIYDTSCSNVVTSINVAATALENEDSSRNIIIDGLTVTGVTPANGSAGLTVAAGVSGVIYRNIVVQDSTEAGMRVSGVLRNVVFENISLINSGEHGLLISAGSGADQNQRLVIRGLSIRNSSDKNLILDNVDHNSINFSGSSTHIGAEITGVTIDGVSQYGFEVAAATTFTDSNLSDWRIDALTPHFVGEGTIASLVDNITLSGSYKCQDRFRGANAYFTDAVDAASCEVGGGAGNHCTCQSLAVTTDLGADNAIGGGDDVEGITQADPAVVHTTKTHYLDVGDEVCLENVGGMTQIATAGSGSLNCFGVGTVPSTTTFSLKDAPGGTDIDSSAFTAYSCSVVWFQGVASCESGEASGWTDSSASALSGGGGIIRSVTGWNTAQANNWRISNARGLDAVRFPSGAGGAGSTSAFNNVSWDGFRYWEDALSGSTAAAWAMNFDNVDTDGSPGDGDRMLTVKVDDPICTGATSGCINFGSATTRRMAEDEDFYAADSGGDAAETTLSLNNYNVMNLSLTEVADVNGSFTTAANEVCYTGSITETFQFIVVTSFDRTSGAGTDVVTFAFGKDTTGAIDDGDEFGEAFQRSLDSAAVGMGSIAAVNTMSTNDCVSLLGKTDDTTGGSGFTMEAAALHILGVN